MYIPLYVLLSKKLVNKNILYVKKPNQKGMVDTNYSVYGYIRSTG